jgi:hypothetical protein
VSRRKGFTVLLKDSLQNLPEGQNVEATLRVGEVPFTAFSAQVQGPDEIAIFPQHGEALAATASPSNRWGSEPGGLARLLQNLLKPAIFSDGSNPNLPPKVVLRGVVRWGLIFN